jgi:exodeoxyribonuclease V alpha subunit
MKDNFIKGFLYKEIYRNEINGYMVGLFKIKDNNIDYDDDMIHITGILPRLSEKKEYILYGEIVYHNKYGKQFNVNSFEVNIPTKEEELIVFLSSDLFPIGEKTAKKIVDTFHEDTDKKSLIAEVLTSVNYNFIVTPKEVDFVIDKLSMIIGNGINKCLHDI